ncbi:SET and MYND domain-containing protein 4-like [Branchiostoma floridae]|uniref:Protein-lysine N-methyltransferase SMYD4 n=1 Tax=Branchiostoma floridae TaxID=7739 RepID=A0A9J7HFQ9_BRAFL|nr:SET and MYND domain-containing protein 4-like [Branchiostoma floridae]
MATSERWKLFQESCKKELGRRLPEFSRLESDEERAKFCLALDCWDGDTLTKLIEKLQSLKGKVGKSTEKANHLRDKGNAAYKAQKFQEAFTLYTDSISYSPVTHVNDDNGTECLSLALANRSAVLFHLQEYKLCLQDIQASIDSGYPENLQYKLLHRKVQALFKLGKKDDAKKEVKGTLEAIEKADIPEDRKEAMRKELKLAGRNISKQEEGKEGEESAEEVKVPKLQYGESQQVAHASGGVEMREEEDKGRMLVAQKAFEPGSVLIVEQPYAAVLLQKHHSTHCHTCVTPVLVPHPCRGCQYVQYCSGTCEEQAWREYHSYECEHWHLLQMVETFAQLSLRLLLTAAARGEKHPSADMESPATASKPSDQAKLCTDKVSPTSDGAKTVQIDSETGSTSEQPGDLSVQTDVIEENPPSAGMESPTTADKPSDQNKLCTDDLSSTSEEAKTDSETESTLEQASNMSQAESTPEQASNLSVKTDSVQNSMQDVELHRGNYSSVYNLMTHTEHHSVEQLLTQMMVSCLMCKCLGVDMCVEVVKKLGLEGGNCTGATEGGGCGENKEGGDCAKSEEGVVCVEKMAALLCHHMQQLRCNAQAITTLQEQDSVSLLEDKQVRLATAVFPTEALLNHSCRPNVFVSFQGKTLIVRAVSHIKPGEELLHCYGPHAGRMVYGERQAALKEQYFFSCSCDACQEQVGNPNTVDMFSAYKCPVCNNAAKLQDKKLVCTSPNCDAQGDTDDIKTTSKKIQDLFVQSSAFLEEGQIQEAVSGLKQCLVLQWKILHPSNKDIARTHDALARCYATSGDCKKSVEHLKKSLSTVELQFGACSVELAHELHKLAQLQFNGQQVAECLDTIERALTIFGCHYGDHHPKSKELRAMKDCLIDVLV